MSIETRRTGHMYYGTSMEACEGSDNCGTCNGGGCMDDVEEFYQCRTTYRVEGLNDLFYDLDEAKAAEKKHEKAQTILIPGYDSTSRPEFWLNDAEELVATYYDFGKRVDGVLEDGLGYIDVKCNPEAETYYQEWATCVDRADRWKKCTCTDKAEGHYGNSCDVHCLCDDASCFWEMQAGRRTEKKWYM